LVLDYCGLNSSYLSIGQKKFHNNKKNKEKSGIVTQHLPEKQRESSVIFLISVFLKKTYSSREQLKECKDNKEDHHSHHLDTLLKS
jgi:hypothetical protein